MKKIGVIGGGFSSEYAISLKSIQTIIDHFPDGYTPIKIILSKEYCWAEWKDRKYEIKLIDRGFQTDSEWIEIDAYWIYIHGDPGENGRLQALFEMHDIPYIGTKMLPSALTFDKWYCNQFVRSFDVPIARSILLDNDQEVNKWEIIHQIGLPLFVKPTTSGSSYGVSKVASSDSFDRAIAYAFEHGQQVVVEEFLAGTEITCAVYRTENGLHTLPLAEIVSDNDFFDYEAKYLGKSQEIIPARIADELTQEVQQLSIKIYQILQLRSVVRIDFMLVNGIAHLIEVNTTPGFSSASLVPQMIQQQGTTIRAFLSNLLSYEIQHHQ